MTTETENDRAYMVTTIELDKLEIELNVNSKTWSLGAIIKYERFAHKEWVTVVLKRKGENECLR